MKRKGENIVNESPWRRASDAMAFFQVGRATLDKIAVQAGAKKKVGVAVLYNIDNIDKYLDSLG